MCACVCACLFLVMMLLACFLVCSCGLLFLVIVIYCLHFQAMCSNGKMTYGKGCTGNIIVKLLLEVGMGG